MEVLSRYNFVQTTIRITGTAAELASENPVLNVGQFGLELDTGFFKVGDGSTVWNDLDYVNNKHEVLPGPTLSLDTPLILADHCLVKVRSGVKTPIRTEMDVDISLNGKYYGVAHQSMYFIWNQDVSAGAELTTGQGLLTDPFVAGTQYKSIGPVTGPGNTGVTARRIRLTGLTPGEPVTWNIIMGASGYYEKYDFPASSLPVDLLLSTDHRTLYVSLFSGGKVMIFDPGNRWSTDGLMAIKGEWNGHPGAHGLSMNPTDPNRIYVSQYSANQVVEVDVRTGLILRTFAITSPGWNVVSTDGTKLFVCRQDSFNDVIPVTLATGVVGSSIDTGDFPTKPVARGAYIYVACALSNRIDRIQVSNNAVTSLATGGSTTPISLSLDPDGDRIWVLEKTGTKRVRAFSVTSFAFTADPAVTGLIGASPNVGLISPSGKSMIVLGNGGSSDFESYVVPARGVVYETANTGDISNGILSMEGDIFGIDTVEPGSLHHYHGARLEIDPTDLFWGGFFDIAFTGVTS